LFDPAREPATLSSRGDAVAFADFMPSSNASPDRRAT
jgi:hypothetical protein